MLLKKCCGLLKYAWTLFLKRVLYLFDTMLLCWNYLRQCWNRSHTGRPCFVFNGVTYWMTFYISEHFTYWMPNFFVCLVLTYWISIVCLNLFSCIGYKGSALSYFHILDGKFVSEHFSHNGCQTVVSKLLSIFTYWMKHVRFETFFTHWMSSLCF